MQSLKARVRGLLHLKRDRRVPRRGKKPGIGACIVSGDLRMTIQAGFSEELWQWLQDVGWRELTYRPDRRHYREIPGAWVTRLTDAMPDMRAAVLEAAAAKASRRPMIGDPTAMPSYVVRE